MSLTPIFDPEKAGRPMRVAAFMSGSGTNITKLLEHEKHLRTEQGASPFEVLFIYSDRSDGACAGEKIAHEHGLPYFSYDIRVFHQKRSIKRTDLKEELDAELSSIEEELENRARRIIDEGIRSVDSLDDGIKLLASGWDGIIRTNWCGEMDCAEEMEKGLDKTFLGYPLKDVDSGEEEKEQGNCMFCGRPTDKVVYISKSY